MPRRCVFCEAQATTKEHALPEWIANRFGLRGVFLHEYGSGGNVNPRQQPISVKSIRRRMLCAECQTHFKALEDRTIPILEPMGIGKSITLDLEAQTTLAEWGAKTAYALFGFLDRDHLVPENHRTAVRRAGVPLPSVFVAYCRYDGPTDIFVSTPLLASPKDVRAPRLSYNAVAAFGQVALKVFSVVEPAPHDVFRLAKDRAVQVWPEWRIPFDWPPPIAIQATEAADLVGWIPVAARGGPTVIATYPGV